VSKLSAGALSRDFTGYARSLGYKGEKNVMVRDGKVVSHGGKDWITFCEGLRKSAILEKKLQESL